MCNLYSQTRNVEAIRRLFRVSHNRVSAVELQPWIFPGYTAPIVRKAADGERELVNVSWDFVFKPADGKAWRRVSL
jgi:putative SOS response-associated peptidase YedK